MPGSPEYLKWEIGSDVSPQDVEAVVDGALLMHEYAALSGMPSFPDEIALYLFHDENSLAARYAEVTGRGLERSREHWRDGTGEAGESWIFVSTSGSWVRKNPRFNLMKMTAHEVFHAFQYGLSELSVGGGVGQVPKAGPRWLSEGTAEYFAYKAMDEGGVADYKSERNSIDPWGFVRHAEYVDKPLNEMETWTGFSGARGDSTYLAIMATELLVFYSGENSILKYYASLRRGTTWQQAFEEAFGMTPNRFYRLFDDHRRPGFPDEVISPRPQQVKMAGAPEYVKFEIGDQVTEDEVGLAVGAVKAMHDYAVSLGMPEHVGDITVYLYHDTDAIALAYARASQRSIEESRSIWRPDRQSGRGGKGYAFASLSVPWVQQEYPYRVFRIVASEFSNALRVGYSELRHSSPGDKVPETGPSWLISGSGDITTTLVGERAGLKTYEDNRERTIRLVKRDPMEQPLSTMETRRGFLASGRSPYRYASLAAELLASRSSAGALLQYYGNLRKGTPWQETFENTFGISISEFYELFEEHRAAGFPVVEIEHP